MILERLKGELPYPKAEEIIAIYNLLLDETNGEVDDELRYDSSSDCFEYPINRITSKSSFWYYNNKNGEINWIKGTNIYWKVENGLFIFGFADSLFSN